MKPIIFTDLDGTLLDPRDYSFREAAPALERVRKAAIPLICVSSKTFSEMTYIRAKLSNNDPFITENGGAVYIPAGYFPFPTAGEESAENAGYRKIPLGRPYGEVRRALNEAREGIGARVRGFGDMTYDEISRLTGLSLHEAALSKIREFAEPFIFEGGEEEERVFAGRIGEMGFTVTRGRLGHIKGGHDKGMAARILKGYFSALFGEIITIALGDGLNDLPLLEEADYPVLVRKADGSYEDTGLKDVVKAAGIGPAGWNLAVNGILDSIQASRTGYRC